MGRKTKNTFLINNDEVSIGHPDWNMNASATIRADYAEEITSIAWSKNGEYVYSSKLRMYLHVYIMRKWYGDTVYETMREAGYVIDHMDNNGFNCCINNLCFLMDSENKAKGLTVDKYSRDKEYIALSMYKDFSTSHIQIAIMFNYPAIARISGLNSPAVIDLAYLLYNREYETVINDARSILLDYKMGYYFEPEKLHDVDFHIEGRYGVPCPKEIYDEYIAGGHGHAVAYVNKLAPRLGWRIEDQHCFFKLRGIPTQYIKETCENE